MLPLLLLAAVVQVDPVEPTPDPRFVTALRLLRPHLSWHAPVAPPDQERRRAIQKDEEKSADRVSPWQEALGPHASQQGDIPRAVINEFERMRRGLAEKLAAPSLEAYFWRLKDPAHPDIRKALDLLDGIQKGPDEHLARRWAAELRRNNTVLTLDVAGAYAAGKPARFILDARNTDHVSLRLYRLASAEDLLRVLDRIGTDFVFRVHETERAIEQMKVGERSLQLAREDREPKLLPTVLKEKPLMTREVPLDKVRRLDPEALCNPGRDTREDDLGRHDDECTAHRHRLERAYLGWERGFSSWRAGLVLDVPGDHLRTPGAYLLQVEANGQFALAPILVEPPALTLRRCPDGVFALVGTEGGNKPLAGALVQARKQIEPTRTDRDGAAFLRVFARGDRAIVVEHEGNFAVGGFGAVFAGVYVTPDDHRRQGWGRDRMDRIRERARDGNLFANGVVLALWTDRPVYLPGETAQVKLIARRRVPKVGGAGFRGEEYDTPALELLPEGTPVTWEVQNSERARVAEGRWSLNEFGTSVGTIQLAVNGKRGLHHLRVNIGEQWYQLPDVFLVDDFTRPAAAVELVGLPGRLVPGSKLTLSLSGRYATGGPVPGAEVELALTNETMRWNLTPDAIVLDKQGNATAPLVLPRHLPGERMALRIKLTDSAGVTTNRTVSVEIEPRSGPLLGRIPKFLPADAVWELSTIAPEVELEQGLTDASPVVFRTTRFRGVGGQVRITFPRPGWFTVRAGVEEQEIFAYGGTDGPDATCTRRRNEADDLHGPWVDLSHYEGGNGSERGALAPAIPLQALFATHEGDAGGSLSVLVYVPFRAARLLLTLEGHSVVDFLTRQVEDEKCRYHLLKIPLRERYLPHVYLQGIILNGVGEEDPGAQQGERKLQKERLEEDEGEDPEWCKIVVRGTRSPGIRVEVKTDRTEYEPGDRVVVDILATDATGKPLDAELALSAVDARLFALASDRLPVVVAALSGTRGAERYQRKTWRSSVGVVPRPDRLRQKQAQQMQKMLAAEAVRLEGADRQRERLLDRPAPRPRDDLAELPVATVPLSPPREASRETAFQAPRLRTNADGSARVEFTVPANLTSYRVSVLALTKDGRIGAGKVMFRARKRLEVAVLLPAELIVGQARMVPVQIHNAGDRERRVTLVTTLTGVTLVGDALMTRTVVVPARGVATIRLALIGRTEGEASVRVQAVDAADDDTEVRRTRLVHPVPNEEPAEPPEAK